VVAECEKVLAKGTTGEKQHVMAVLAEAAVPAADELLAKAFDLLVAKQSTPALQLDVLEAAQARSESVSAFKEKLGAFEAARAAAAGTPAAFSECLEGGDAKLGKQAVLENLAANCIACHRFDKRDGSNVGPPLFQIGSQRDRAYLLEALVAPQAKIAPGYGMISVTLKNKEVVTGALAEGDAKQLQVRLADGKVRKIALADVISKTDPVSVMPPMGAILTKRQVRDVVAYLSSLTAAPSKTKKGK
jgi:putative heme-binding domain-containing protein